MDWNQKYIEMYKKNNRFTVNSRILKFKINPPVKKEHFSELEYLIINYDYSKTLLNRYENVISEKAKIKWLKKHTKSDSKYSHTSNNIYFVFLPFYLINPQSNNPKIDKHFLDDQLMLILGAIDHKFKKYRWRAIYLFQFLIPNFKKLRSNQRKSIIKLLTVKSNTENIQKVNHLIFINLDVIDVNLINEFFYEQMAKEIINPKMAIGILRRVSSLNDENQNKLKEEILKLENGEYILNKINVDNRNS